jgi:hypothetical protein
MARHDGKAKSFCGAASPSVYDRLMLRPALALSLAFVVPLAAAAAAPRSFASVEEFARFIGMKPGGWRTSLTVTALEVELPPGADPAAVAAFKAAMPLKVGSVEERDECAGDTPDGPSLPGILLDKGCSFSRMEGGDGRWSVESTCRHRGHGGLATIAAQGSYAAETVTGVQQVDLAFDGVVVHVKGEIMARFTGQCRPPAPPVSVSVERPN